MFNDILREKTSGIYRKIQFFRFFKIFCSFFVLAMFICGAALIILRYFKCGGIVLAVAIISGLVAAIFTSIVLFRKKTFSLSDASAWIDNEQHFGGMLMSLVAGNDISEWDKVTSGFRMPECRLDFRAPVASILCAVAFVTACAFIPIPQPLENLEELSLDINVPCSEMQDKIRILEETGILDKERQKTIEESIEELRRNKSAMQPGKILENIDGIDSKLDNIAEMALNQMNDASEMMKKMEWAAEKLSADPDDATEKMMRDELAKFAEMLKESPELGGALAKGGLSPELSMKKFLSTPPPANSKTLDKLSKMMKNSRSGMCDSAKKLRNGGMCDGGSLDKFLEKNKPEEGFGKEKDGDGVGYGKGGVDRGRGDAPMIFGDESQKLENRPGPEKIDPNGVGMDTNETVGMSFSEPEAEVIDDNVSGVLNTDTGSGGESRRYPVAPRNTRIIKRYFDKK